MDEIDYFASKEHFARVEQAVDREVQRLNLLVESEGIFVAMSDAIGSMTAHISIFRSLGLKQVAVKLLQDALRIAKNDSCWI